MLISCAASTEEEIVTIRRIVTLPGATQEIAAFLTIARHHGGKLLTEETSMVDRPNVCGSIQAVTVAVEIPDGTVESFDAMCRSEADDEEDPGTIARL